MTTGKAYAFFDCEAEHIENMRLTLAFTKKRLKLSSQLELLLKELDKGKAVSEPDVFEFLNQTDISPAYASKTRGDINLASKPANELKYMVEATYPNAPDAKEAVRQEIIEELEGDLTPEDIANMATGKILGDIMNAIYRKHNYQKPFTSLILCRIGREVFAYDA